LETKLKSVENDRDDLNLRLTDLENILKDNVKTQDDQKAQIFELEKEKSNHLTQINNFKSFSLRYFGELAELLSFSLIPTGGGNTNETKMDVVVLPPVVIPKRYRVRVVFGDFYQNVQDTFIQLLKELDFLVLVDEDVNCVTLNSFPLVSPRLDELAPNFRENDIPIAFRRATKDGSQLPVTDTSGKLLEVIFSVSRGAIDNFNDFSKNLEAVLGKYFEHFKK